MGEREMSTEKTKNVLVETAGDMFIVCLESVKRRVNEAVNDISEDEYNWEPISNSERSSDLHLPPDKKKVWRVFQKGGVWVYDYTPETLNRPPFTTIAWIMNHIAQTGDMYLYCVKTGKPEGVDRSWDDLPVYPECEQMGQYIFQVLGETEAYLKALPDDQIKTELNKLTPAPWGEMRLNYKNIWGGIIGHAFEHAVQISALKHRIRFGD
jgi:hypothetical protein